MSLRVLVVDDDPEQLELVQRQLRIQGFEVQTAESSLGVSNQARRFAPDVVLIDVHIPALSGDRLLAILRETSPRKDMRLVLFSAVDLDRLRALAMSVGADGWIRKGVTADELGREVRRIVGAPRDP